MNRKQLEKIYDELYHKAEAVLKEFNPCEHKINSGKHSCLGSRQINTNNPGPQCCCGGCKHWTNKGCNADKPLTCKTWLCTISKIKYPLVAKKLNEIVIEIDKYDFYVFRGDKNASISQAMSYVEREQNS